MNMQFADIKIYDAIIIGTGFAGIGMGIKLKEHGYHNFAILERDEQLGGTWRDNTYPGAACDVPSYLYSYSFEPYPKWSRMFSPHNEILAYNKHCIEKYELTHHIYYNASVEKASFNEQKGLWKIETADGKKYLSKIFIPCTGPLNKPQFPKIKGIKKFEGRNFHTSLWEHDVDLTNKNVAVIGTGASAIQVIPSIADKVKSLKVFQRTPAWVLPKPDREISKLEQKATEFAPILQSIHRASIYWGLEWRAFAFTRAPKLFKVAELQGKAHINKYVKDPELRKKLTPEYTLGCKRVLLSNDYYQAMAKPRVEVITTGIDKIKKKSIVDQDGKEYKVDVIIYATGFIASDDMAPFEVIGLNNTSLKQLWQHGGQAYLGMTMNNFPNAFMVTGPNTGLGHSSMIFMMESCFNYVIKALPHILNAQTNYINTRADIQEDYNKRLQKRMQKTIWMQGGCNSWYLNKDGINTTLWPGFTAEYRVLTSRFNPKDYEIHKKKTGRNKNKKPIEIAIN